MTGRGPQGAADGSAGPVIERAFPLTPLQEGMLYHSVRNPGAGLYHVQCVARLEGPLDERRFREAWRLAAARHESLRTRFAWTGRPRPAQVVLSEAPLDLRLLDWSGWRPDEQQARWDALLERDRRQPFDLERAPVTRLVVARTRPGTHRLLWSVHHALLDGWSLVLVLGEVLEDCEALRTGSPTTRPDPPTFARFVGWLEGRDHAAAAAYWREALAGIRRPTPLPLAAHGGSGLERATARAELSEADTGALRAAAARMRVTLSTATVAAWALLLSRHSAEGEVVLGSTQSERPAEIAGVQRASGLYLSTIPVRVEVPPGAAVGPWLVGLQRTLSEARSHAAPGLPAIRRWSGMEGELFHSLVVFESLPEAVARSGGDGALRAVELSMTGPSDLPLALLAHPGERFGLEMVHDPERVPPDAAHRLLDELSELLRELGRDAGRTLGELPGGGRPAGGGHAALRSERVGGAQGLVPEGAPIDQGPDVLDLFEARVLERPAAVAIRTSAERLTYAELDEAAERIARAVRAAGTVAGSLVGVLGDRSPGTVAALLGVLKAECAYLPLDPELPALRLRSMAAHASLVLGPAAELRRLGPHLPPSLALEDVASHEGPAEREVEGGGPSGGEPVAYVVFTSGSTGEPKGVVVTRRQLAWSTAARFAHYRDHPGAFLLLSPLAVDSSVAGLYWTLCAGGTLVLPGRRAEQDPDALARLVEEAGVTHTLLLPSLHRALLEHVDPARLRTLRLVVVAGERCPEELVRQHASALPGVALHNEYGPSEGTVWATADELTAAPDGPVTIGRPVPGARVHLLEPGGSRPVDPGSVGEICIGGPGVAQGYLGRPELMAERFMEEPGRRGGRMYRTGDLGQWLEDGRLAFRGRLDDQVKVRGFRVELGEVERALEGHPAVSEAVVVLTTASPAPSVDALVDALMARSGGEAERLLRAVESAP